MGSTAVLVRFKATGRAKMKSGWNLKWLREDAGSTGTSGFQAGVSMPRRRSCTNKA